MFELADSSFSARLFQFHPKPICTLEHCHKTNEGAGAAGAGMQLHGAFQSHVLRLCALQILLEALVCKSNKCLGKVGLWLINIEKYHEIPTDHAGNRNLRAPQAKHTKYGAQISDKHLSVLNYENRSVRPALQNMLDPPRFGHQWLVAPPISWPWTMTRLMRSVSHMHLHIFDAFADPVSWSLKFDMLKLMANVRICTITRFRPKPQNFMQLLLPCSTLVTHLHKLLGVLLMPLSRKPACHGPRGYL